MPHIIIMWLMHLLWHSLWGVKASRANYSYSLHDFNMNVPFKWFFHRPTEVWLTLMDIFPANNFNWMFSEGLQNFFWHKHIEKACEASEGCWHLYQQPSCSALPLNVAWHLDVVFPCAAWRPSSCCLAMLLHMLNYVSDTCMRVVLEVL